MSALVQCDSGDILNIETINDNCHRNNNVPELNTINMFLNQM